MVAENEEILSYPESGFCVDPMFLFIMVCVIYGFENIHVQ